MIDGHDRYEWVNVSDAGSHGLSRMKSREP